MPHRWLLLPTRFLSHQAVTKEQLTTHNITRVLCCTGHDDHSDVHDIATVLYVFYEDTEQQQLDEHGDWHISSVDQVSLPPFSSSKLIDICYQFIKEEGNVLIQCTSGVSRSVSVVCYYLMKSMNISYDQAIAIVKQERPQAQPNQGFVKQLRKFSISWAR